MCGDQIVCRLGGPHASRRLCHHRLRNFGMSQSLMTKTVMEYQGCHGTGKTENSEVHFSRQGEHSEFAKNC